MAMIGHFDANTVAPAESRDLLPPGDYVAQIVKSEMKATKPKNGGTSGEMLVLEMEIIDGMHTSRRLWDRLNLVNANSQAVEIAQRTLSSICRATGQMTVTDSEQLHLKPMVVKVVVEPARGEYGPSNSVKGYSATGGACVMPFTSPTPTKPTTPAAPAAASVPPWRKTATA